MAGRFHRGDVAEAEEVPDPTETFYAGLPVITSFSSLADPSRYTPLPPGWILGLSDVMQSTAAIEGGRYKAVNTAGAALIAALSNALGGSSRFPFSFGGDGASFAVSQEHREIALEALAQTAAWVRDDLGLTIRAALLAIEEIRAAGQDVKVARFAPSVNVSYAMFTGGGLAYADAKMKSGDFLIEAAPKGSRPDLTGLSCRFEEIPAERGVILSLIVVPAHPDVEPTEFRAVVEAILQLAEGGTEARRPVPDVGPPTRWPPRGLALEALATRGRDPLWLSQIRVAFRTLVAHAVFKQGRAIGAFNPSRYVQELVENTDFRKFDDGLRMTLDCTPALVMAIERRLAQARSEGLVRYGVKQQEAALMTCFVPSPTSSDHVHFVDGAAGGYASAAQSLKLMLQ